MPANNAKVDTCLEYRIIASRPRAQNEHWVDKIQQYPSEQGLPYRWRALSVPLLEIVAVDDTEAKRRIQTQVLDLDSYQKVIFVSQNAVEHFFLWLEDFWLQLPQNLCLIGVGEKTKQAIQEQLDRWGNAGDQTVIGGEDAMNSESLLAMEVLQKVEGEKVLICRGQGGRPKLGEELALRGAAVDYCELYVRTLPVQAVTQLGQVFLDPETDVVPVFSGETLSNLVQVLAMLENREAKAPFRLPVQWRELTIVVPGERVAQGAAAVGFKRVTIATNASETEMLAAMQNALPVE